MSVSNNSWIASQEELWQFLEQKHVYELLTTEADDVVEVMSSPLLAEQQDRLYQALNWARNFLISGMRERYDFTLVTAANAPEVLKSLNARLCQWALEKRRYRNAESCTDDMDTLRGEIELYAKESSMWSLDIARQASPFGIGRNSNATAFDAGGQFDNLIPSAERDDIWPDLSNA